MTDAARDLDTEEEELYGLTAEQVHEVQAAIADGAVARIEELVEPLHAADLADLIEAIEPEERRLLIAIVRHTFDPETLPYLEESVREEVIEMIGPQELAHAVTELDTDDAVELLQDLDEDEKRRILDSVPAENRRAIEEGLTYPEDSAGRLMQRSLVAVPEHWTVGETIDFLRASRELPDDFYDLFVVNPMHKPIGSVPLSRAMRNGRAVRLVDIMETELRTVSIAMDQESVANLFRQYGLVSVPVVDADDRLVGVITVDDVVDVIDEEAEEDLLGFVGAGETDLHDSAFEVAWARVRWLFVTLVNAAIASSVILQFEATIEEIVALAVLMPIVAAMGGNAGVQVVATIVRSIATRRVTPGVGSWRIIGKEVAVNAINACVFAAVVGVAAALWFHNWPLGGVLAGAMIFNMVWAGFAGTVIPLTLARLKVDPAIGAGPFLTTTTDVLGFFSFLGLATLFLL